MRTNVKFKTLSIYPNGKVETREASGKKFIVPNSKYTFAQDKRKLLHNIESGMLCGLPDYVIENLEYIESEISRMIDYFGKASGLPESKMFPTWYQHYAKDFYALFKFNLPVDICGVDVIKLDDRLQPRSNESLKQAIKRQYGEQAETLVAEMLENPPFCFYFYRSKSKNNS